MKVPDTTELSMHRTFLSTARSHMSNERTHLSYLRTSLSLMSFGITLNRFSIFMRENQVSPKAHNTLIQTEIVGVGMVSLGIIILAWALKRFKRVDHEIETDTFTSELRTMSLFTWTVLLLGGLTTLWMFFSRK